MGKTRSPTLVPIHATRRNTASDRKAGCGSTAINRSSLKRAGYGCANWGRPGDELYDDSSFDLTDLSAEEAWAAASGLEWAEVDELSDEDSSNMDALEEAMREDWLSAQENEALDLQDEGEDFFNSLDPRSWVE
jgi:hypothetical protein